MPKKLVVVLATYNEKENIEKVVRNVLAQEKFLTNWEIGILIADSSSPDGTADVAKKIVSQNPKVHLIIVGKGLGVGLIEAHRYSLEHLHPDLMAQIDSDGQVEADVLIRMVEAVEEGYDFVQGSRFAKGGRNELSFSRRLFSLGASLVCRLIMGPWDIKEVTNSARAFTPQLFKKMNLERMPWREKTFIIQPAFLHEAVLAGAKYKEVPLVFKNRAEGYSKNKVINYIFDMVTYAIDARLHMWGFDIPFFRMTRRLKTFVKFAVVGFSGTVVDFVFYNIFIQVFALMPASSKVFSAEIAIFNNFTLNHLWTFRYRKNETPLGVKFIIFNVVSLGGVAIAAGMIKFLHITYGDGLANILGISFAFYNLYFFATVPIVMIWNFTVNHFVTWKHQKN